MSLFNWGKRPAPAPKQFRLRNKFEYILQFCLLVCASDFDNDFRLSIQARANGEIDLQVVGDISFFPRLLRDVDPSVERFFCSSNHYNYSGNFGTMRFHFSEPDCYIYRCPQGPFQDEVTEYAPNGYLDTFQKYPNGDIIIGVQFKRQSDDQRWECFNHLEKRASIWLQ